MSSDVFVVCSMALTHGAAIALAVWELIRLRRYRADDAGRDHRPAPLPAPPPAGGDAIRKPHGPLPACLIPVRRSPARLLEDA